MDTKVFCTRLKRSKPQTRGWSSFMKALSYAHTKMKRKQQTDKLRNTGPYTCQRIIWYIKLVSFFFCLRILQKKVQWSLNDSKGTRNNLKKKIPHQNAQKNRLNVQPDHPVFAYPLVNDHNPLAGKSTHFLIGNTSHLHSVSIWKIARWVDPGVYRFL